MKATKFSVFILNFILSFILVSYISRVYSFSSAAIPEFDVGSATINYRFEQLIPDGPELDTFSELRMDSESSEKLKGILASSGLILISNDQDNPGLGVYDPVGYFDSYELSSGVYSDLFLGDSAFILDNSWYLLGRTMGDVFDSMDHTFTIQGTYNKKHPLYSMNKEYFYQFFDNPIKRGRFTISSVDKNIGNQVFYSEIIPMFQEYGLNVVIEHDYSNPNFFLIAFKNGHFVFSSLIVIIMYSVLWFFYNFAVDHNKKMLSIHSKLGATNIKIMRLFLKFLFLYIFISTLSGSLFGIYIFKYIINFSLIEIFLLSFFVHFYASLILLMIAVFVNFAKIQKAMAAL